MKSTFLKILPIAAALLLAVSCGEDAQDDSGVVVNPEPETANVVNTIPTAPDNLTPATPVDDEEGEPFTLKVIAGTPLSKMSYNDDGVTVNMKLDASDIGSEMLVFDDENMTGHYIIMTLESVDTEGNGTFKGNRWEHGAPAEGTVLTASLGLNNGSHIESSTESITDLMEKCPHRYKGTFRYITDNSVTLYDALAYIEFTLADEQKQVFVNDEWYDVNQETHKAWVVVDPFWPVETRIKGTKTLEPGYIYTLSFPDYVDLGQTVDGKIILWKTENETTEIDGGTHSFEYEGNDYAIYYSDVHRTFGYSVDVATDRLPTWNEFNDLDDFYVSFDNTIGHKGACFENDHGSLFLPACGMGGYAKEYSGGGFIVSDEYTDDPFDERGTIGYYWVISSNKYDAHIDFAKSLSKKNKLLKLHQPNDWDGGGIEDYDPYFSVRLVRGL